MQKIRTLLTNRKLLKRKLIDLENLVRATLRAYGLLVGAVARGDGEARIRELIEHSDTIFVMSIQVMLDVRRTLIQGYDRLHRVLLQVVQHDLVCRRLMTVPGVGPVAALSFKVGVDDPHRFARLRTSARIWDWCRGGTNPARRSITKDASANRAISPAF